MFWKVVDTVGHAPSVQISLDMANRNCLLQSMRQTMSDILNMPVTFMGENPVKQLMLANGTLLVTDLFETPQEAVERFGKRIRTMEREFHNSQQYNDGIAHAKAGKPYAPTRSHGKQAVLEYGTGYLRGLIEGVPVAPAAKTTLTEAEHNAMMDKEEGRGK